MTRSGIIAEAIRSATYGELMDIATDFSLMQQDRERDLTSVNDWAEILNSWAEANEDADDDRERPEVQAELKARVRRDWDYDRDGYCDNPARGY